MSLYAKFTKSVGSFRLTAEISAPDGITALFGHSGCGKSMTLRCLAGVENPDEGVIVIDGTTVFDSAAGICIPPQRRGVGLLFQEYALFPTFTAARNIAAGLPRDLPRREKEKQTEELLRRFGLSDVAGQLPRDLSGGQRQRTALARMMAAHPSLILLDEPFAALDGDLRLRTQREMADLMEDFTGTAVLVSHDRDEVRRLAACVCVMDRGRTFPVIPTEELFSRPTTVAAARLTGCENFAPAYVSEDGFVRIPSWGLSRPAKAGERGTAAGVRSNAFTPEGGGSPLSVLVQRVFPEEKGVLLQASYNGEVLYIRWPPRKTLHPGDRIDVFVSPDDIMLLEE